jgi:hypothetical protein
VVVVEDGVHHDRDRDLGSLDRKVEKIFFEQGVVKASVDKKRMEQFFTGDHNNNDNDFYQIML